MSSTSIKLAKAIKTLQNLKDIQGAKGNYDFDPYMHGMFNGLELAMSVLTGREPEYKEAPKKWGKDKKTKPKKKIENIVDE